MVPDISGDAAIISEEITEKIDRFQTSEDRVKSDFYLARPDGLN